MHKTKDCVGNCFVTIGAVSLAGCLRSLVRMCRVDLATGVCG